jgi:hypothetical protein
MGGDGDGKFWRGLAKYGLIITALTGSYALIGALNSSKVNRSEVIKFTEDQLNTLVESKINEILRSDKFRQSILDQCCCTGVQEGPAPESVEPYEFKEENRYPIPRRTLVTAP